MSGSSTIESLSYEWQPLPEDGALPLDAHAGRSALSVGGLWFLTSAIFSTWANTAFLRELRSPSLHALVRFSTSALVGIGASPTLTLARVPSLCLSLWQPASFLLAANVLNSVALHHSGITICYVVKSAIPVLTVCVCVLRGDRFPPKVFVSLVPTVLGVALASASDADYCAAGVAAAVGSALAQVSLNLTSKAALKRLGLSGADGQSLLSSACALASLPLCVLLRLYDGVAAAEPLPPPPPPRALGPLGAGSWRTAGLVAAAGLAYHAEYTLNFSYVRLVSPLSFSVTDVARRLAIIVSGAVLFRKPLTPLNTAGVLLSLGGVVCFLAATSEAGVKRRKRAS